MRNKLRRRFIAWTCLLCVGPTFAESPVPSLFQHKQLGRCFANSRSALAAISGTVEPIDENVNLRRADISDNSHWVIDKTSEHNYQWYLLEQLKGQHCVTLYIPFASEARAIRNQRSVDIVAQTQASPGGYQYKMIFRRSRRLGQFVPVKCTRTEEATQRRATSATQIDCLTVGD